MFNGENLHGIYVPVITPFLPDESLDRLSYDCYISELLSHDIQGLVINGTTGESPTVSWEEVRELVYLTKAIMARVEKWLPIIVGTGTNDTRSTVRRTEMAFELGADAALVVVPYYSRPSQEGVIEHFKVTAQIGLPIIVYEVPYRTGISLNAHTAAAILSLDGVVGMKDSSGALDLFTSLKQLDVSKPILCGEDMNFLAMLNQGAAGGILASANIRTELFIETYRLYQNGQQNQAADVFHSLTSLIRLLFQETNPAPIKWLLSHEGILSSDTLRLPLMPISEALKQQLVEELKSN